MTDEEMHKLALEIRQALIPPRCVSTEIPRDIQEEIKKACYGRPFETTSIVPMGAYGILIRVDIQTSGEILLDLKTMKGDTFWRVYLGNEDMTIWRDNNGRK